jgi:beta-mannosidase
MQIGRTLALALVATALCAQTEKPLWQPYYISPRTGAQHVALGGTWQLGYQDAPSETPATLAVRKWIRTQVPGTVQMALYRAGELPNPYSHLNSRLYRWTDEKVWYYRRSFDVPESARGKYAFLCFDGLDYYARVWLNGSLLGRHEGMFGGPEIEVSQLLRFGHSNEVVVEIRAADWGRKATWNARATGSVIAPWEVAGGPGAEAFFPLGMWRPARVEFVPHTHLERPFLTTVAANAGEARLHLTVEALANVESLQFELHPWKTGILGGFRDAWTSRPMERPFTLRIEMLPRAGGVALRCDIPLHLSEGRNWISQDVRMPSPELWWPNGMGKPNLYRVRLTLLDGGTMADRLEFDFGIRTVTTVPTAGPRTQDRWADWQFVVNGQKLFIKGVNWMPADLLLDLPRARYRWLLGLAHDSGIQLVRVWGAGLLETDEFYSVANELGIMVWQDFPIANQETPEFPQDVWEAQVVQNIFRLRNHPALVLYNGGNEFNPYSFGNATALGILERSVRDFDGTRPFRRASPDAGSIHTYPDMDPTWYAKLYKLVPYVSETGMHNIPEPRSILEAVDPKEVPGALRDMFSPDFPKTHPDLMHHFVEYQPTRVPRMLSRASQIDDMSAPSLAALAEATQIGAGEFYQILSESMQANYPVTAGLMPWVFKRPWPVIAIMLVDGFGQPTAPYYFLKRTYELTHVMVDLPELMWAKGEEVPIRVRVLRAAPTSLRGARVSVEISNHGFVPCWKKEQAISVSSGPSVAKVDLGKFRIPNAFEDHFFFIVTELKDGTGALISRSVYWPRCLKSMEDPQFRAAYRGSPQPALTFQRGPWLKQEASAVRTSLKIKLLSARKLSDARMQIQVRATNEGSVPAFMTDINIEGARRCFGASDNFFWLAPGESKKLNIEVLWRDAVPKDASVTLSAWNAPEQHVALNAE